MVRHQTIGPDRNLALGRPLGHQRQIRTIIVIVKESLLAAVAALGNVVGQSRYDHSRDSCHAPTLCSGGATVKRIKYGVLAPSKAWERRKRCNDYIWKPLIGVLWVANPTR
jgi:hypothetical protein